MHYTNIFIASLIFISISTNAQEFDKDFLSSLPDDIKEDLLEKIIKDFNLREPVYRNLSTEIDKDVLANSKEIFGSNFLQLINPLSCHSMSLILMLDIF